MDKPVQEPHEPTEAEESMGHSIHYMVGSMLRGEVQAIGVCAKMKDGTNSVFFLDPDLEGMMLSEPIQKLRSMYELNQAFRQKTTAPPRNRSYRSH